MDESAQGRNRGLIISVLKSRNGHPAPFCKQRVAVVKDQGRSVRLSGSLPPSPSMQTTPVSIPETHQSDPIHHFSTFGTKPGVGPSLHVRPLALLASQVKFEVGS